MSQPIGSVCCNNTVQIYDLINVDGEYAGDLFQCDKCESFSLEARG